MNLVITKRFKEIQDTKSIYFKDINIVEKYLDQDADFNVDQMISFLTKKFSRIGYHNVDERFIDILNIDSFHFHAWLEADQYSSQIEINIEKVYSNLSLLDYDEELWFEGQPEEEKTLWKTFRSFDTRPEIGDNKMAVFSIKEGVSPPAEPAIYFLDRAKAFKTNLTFVQYYDAVLDMMGIADWQLLFADISWNDPQVEDYYSGLKESLEALSKAFPEKDYSKYFELLESKWK